LFWCFELDLTYNDDGDIVSFCGLSDYYENITKLLDAMAPYVEDDGFVVWINDEQWVEVDYFLHGRWTPINVEWRALAERTLREIAEANLKEKTT